MVYPQTPTTYWSFKYALPFEGKKALMPPLGLMTVASMLLHDYEVKLIDMNIAPLRREEIEAADLVFVSAMIVQRETFTQVVKLCNECGTTIVAGGPYASSAYADITGVDHFVLDEAEVTLPPFLEDFEAGHPKRMYRSQIRCEMRESPPPRFDIVDVKAYDTMPLQFSRGCPFNCEFCDIIEMFGRTPRTKSDDQFVHELSRVYQTGFRGQVFIVDDNFVGNRRRVKSLLRALIGWQERHRYPFHLSTEASIDLAQDDELLELLVKAGFHMVFVGLETPDEATLRHTKKSQNVRTSLLDSVEKIQRKGIEVTGGFILGFDTDPDDIFERQIRFIHQAAIPTAMVGLLQALPNTQLFRRLQKEGRLLQRSTGNNTNDLRLDFVPRMSQEALIRGYKRVISKLYSPRQYFERCLLLRSRLPAKRPGWRIPFGVALKAFLLSLARQSFSSYGHHYLKYLLASLRFGPRHFVNAVSFAINGYHFMRMTDEILKADEFATMLEHAFQSIQSRLSMIFDGGARQSEQALAYIATTRMKFERDYRRLSLQAREYVKQTFALFLERCQRAASQMNQPRTESAP